MSGPLPAPPADPLRILPAWSLLLLLAAAALLLLAAAWLLYRFLRRRRPPEATAPPPVPRASPAATPAVPIARRIEAIERKYLKTKAFRDGCHALAGAVKSHFGVERLTSPEIARSVEDLRVGRFMTALSWRRYGREEPRRKDFVQFCTEAREILA